ncbi:MAG: hypothetical protein Q4Q58_01785 [Thermoplasmata archaeon]|nr:hypothetical protein [Thermoplasmata archaeon]
MKDKIIAVIIAVIVVVAAVGAYVALSDSDDGNGGSTEYPLDVIAELREVPSAEETETEYTASLEILAETFSDTTATADEMETAFSDSYTIYVCIVEWDTWITIDYYLDQETYGAEYTLWTTLTATAFKNLASVVSDGLDGSCGTTVDAAIRSYGFDPEEFRGYDSATAEETALLTRISGLEDDYYAIDLGDYTYTYGGTTWTYATASASTTLTSAEQATIISAIVEDYYTDCAEVYIDLIEARNDLAEIYGYDTYIDYAYKETYSRDYTPDDIDGMLQVGVLSASLYSTLNRMMTTDQSLSSDTISWLGDLSYNDTLVYLDRFLSGVDSDLSGVLDYLDRNGTLLVEDGSGGQITAGFTASLPVERGAVVYLCGYSGYNEFRGLVHELGHASNTCLNFGSTSCMDVREIHSSGLEALLAASASDVIGDSGDALTVAVIASLANTISTTSIFAVFEAQVYEMEASGTELTVDLLRSTYKDLLDSVGLSYSSSYGYLSWAGSSNLVVDAGYVVSYAVSGLSSLEIFVDAVENWDAAVDEYMDILNQTGVSGYSAAVEAAGMLDMLETDNATAAITTAYYAIQYILSS